ncbi:MAG: DUF2238 domain-containing protein [Steroidobacteraceae bacterium]
MYLGTLAALLAALWVPLAFHPFDRSELIEWGAALVVGGDLGQAYLGTQGDEWDAHKDMALAALGALISMCVTAGINIYLQRDFAREWAESLRIHGRQPLGEVAIRQMLDQQGSA